MFKYTPVLLLLSIPLLGGAPLIGLPLWVWGSLAATLLYGIVLIVVIEKRWDAFKEEEDG